MSPRQLLAGPIRSFVDLDTLKRMSEVARNMAAARKVVAEIQGIEDSILAQGVTTKDLSLAMADMAALARVAAKSTVEAVGILERMALDVEAYVEKERMNASG